MNNQWTFSMDFFLPSDIVLARSVFYRMPFIHPRLFILLQDMEPRCLHCYTSIYYEYIPAFEGGSFQKYGLLTTNASVSAGSSEVCNRNRRLHIGQESCCNKH